jgi:hypothetical protein
VVEAFALLKIMKVCEALTAWFAPSY